jgi:hypothetical protein
MEKIKVFEPTNEVSLDRIIQKKINPNSRLDNVGYFEKIDASTSSQYLDSKKYPSSYQAQLTQYHAFSQERFKSQRDSKSDHRGYLGSKIPAVMNFKDAYPILCKSRHIASKVANELKLMTDHYDFSKKETQCLFIKVDKNFQPIVIGHPRYLDIVEKHMKETHPNATFKKDDYEIDLLPRQQNKEKKVFNKKEVLDLMFGDEGKKFDNDIHRIINYIRSHDVRHKGRRLLEIYDDPKSFEDFKNLQKNKLKPS